MLTLGGNNPCLIPAPTGLEGNLHKGYAGAIDSPSLKSESSLISALLLSVCVYLCIYLFLPVCMCLSGYLMI